MRATAGRPMALLRWRIAVRPASAGVDPRGVDGLATTRRILANPHRPDVRVAIPTTFDDDPYVYTAPRSLAGALTFAEARYVANCRYAVSSGVENLEQLLKSADVDAGTTGGSTPTGTRCGATRTSSSAYSSSTTAAPKTCRG